ncbi:MAG: RloB family protein [Sphaerochaetaceae bacterium]
MILKSRLFEKKEPDRDASLFIIYCEGARREPDYFGYFENISSRVKLEIIKADSQGDNSPKGLLEQAKKDLKEGTEEHNPKYVLEDGDQVWFVIDTDAWGKHISTLCNECDKQSNWYVAQSNPCFEIWLLYHFHSDDASKIIPDECESWKKYVDKRIKGGFDSRRHPFYIEDAIKNSEKHYRESDGFAAYGSTQVYRLGKALLPLIATTLQNAKGRLRINSKN